ncbi:MAG TPA: hypothetical protein VL625_04895 [Patescibacteria group bacterium]|nr:hypothetical protein [Patescibacteria group bacterium]
MSDSPIYGVLRTQTVELPWESPERQAEADKTNRELKGLARVFRGATDWAMAPYEDAISNMDTRPRARPPVVPLKSGDLVKVFKTVSDGDVLWAGKVEYDYTQYHHGLQKNLAPQKWADMFYDELPAKLEHEGKIIYGALEPFAETGTEGTIWAVHEYGKAGYEGLHYVEGGDQLTVYSNVRDGEVDWEGKLDFGPEQVTKIGWTEVMRESRHMSTEEWLQMSYQNRPVVVTPAPKNS